MLHLLFAVMKPGKGGADAWIKKRRPGINPQRREDAVVRMKVTRSRSGTGRSLIEKPDCGQWSPLIPLLEPMKVREMALPFAKTGVRLQEFQRSVKNQPGDEVLRYDWRVLVLMR
jgi:hypothetical protein